MRTTCMWAWALGLFFSANVVQAQEGVTTGSVATEVPAWGVMLSLGNPYPMLLGVSGVYHINRDLRASIGYGEIEVTTSLGFSGGNFVEEKVKATAMSGGIEYLFLDLPVRGIVGLRGGYLDVSGKGDIDLSGFDSSTGYVYANLGLDWLSRSGVQLGAGLNVAALGATGTGFYVNSGWFF